MVGHGGRQLWLVGKECGLSPPSEDTILEPIIHSGKCWHTPGRKSRSQWLPLVSLCYGNEAVCGLFCASFMQSSEPEGGKGELRDWNRTCRLEYPIEIDNQSVLVFETYIIFERFLEYNCFPALCLDRLRSLTIYDVSGDKMSKARRHIVFLTRDF